LLLIDEEEEVGIGLDLVALDQLIDQLEFARVQLLTGNSVASGGSVA